MLSSNNNNERIVRISEQLGTTEKQVQRVWRSRKLLVCVTGTRELCKRKTRIENDKLTFRALLAVEHYSRYSRLLV